MPVEILSSYRPLQEVRRHAAQRRGAARYPRVRLREADITPEAPIIDGCDIIVQAPPGMGMTTAFLIASLETIEASARKLQALFLASTPELARQIYRLVVALGTHTGPKCHVCIDGTRAVNDVRVLEKETPHIIVGTPDRVHYLIRRRVLATSGIHFLCLDGADEMISHAGIHDVFRYMRSTCRIGLACTTMSEEVLQLKEEFISDPVRIIVKQDELIKHFYITIGKEQKKVDALCDLFSTSRAIQAIVYANSARAVERLAEKMGWYGFSVSVYHGDMVETERDGELDMFRCDSSRVLITTDQLDLDRDHGVTVQQVDLIVNYDLPGNRENYIQHARRVGGLGHKGVVVNFCNGADERYVRTFQRVYDVMVDVMP